VKAEAVAACKADHSVKLLLQIAGLARSTFFYHHARQRRPDRHAVLAAAIGKVFTDHHGRYGHRQIRNKLIGDGYRVAKKTVLRLMRRDGLRCHVRRKRRWSSFQGDVGVTAPNLLDRDFTAALPNQKWVTDVTEFRVGDRKLYLSPVMDLFDRQIIAYRTGTSPNLDLTNESLLDAFRSAPTASPLVHSDQGMHYRHKSWRALRQEAGATQSMSRKGNCYDNAVMENFFGQLKTEMFHHTRFASIADLTTAIGEYVHWYNTVRTSTRLEGMSPVNYRTHALAA
jgi:putative transposase